MLFLGWIFWEVTFQNRSYTEVDRHRVQIGYATLTWHERQISEHKGLTLQWTLRDQVNGEVMYKKPHDT